MELLLLPPAIARVRSLLDFPSPPADCGEWSIARDRTGALIYIKGISAWSAFVPLSLEARRQIGGVNIYPLEIEAVFGDNGRCTMGVFGVPTSTMGRRRRCWWNRCRAPTLTSESIRSSLALHLADYRVTRRVASVLSLLRS